MKLFETLKSLKKEDGYRYCVISDMKVANELLGKIYPSDHQAFEYFVQTKTTN